ncbi:pilus assembly protein TadG-related protein [Zavarzinia compransoris]|uniref:pilus assembly protein TadG-related protein n=1 Tax=Zavarzinia marina TaxID=2911065 RepID=UPI001F2A180E|nr:pilus assembly protein TadG-related protein [Zavarzinia marina]MCF4166429.1 pilus assembly protein TadG-related protein [Zavarzinia marina]
MTTTTDHPTAKAASRHGRGERGASAILLAVGLFMFIAVTAIVVDIGYGFYSKQRLQDTLDLAAIAAARELTGVDGADSNAMTSATQVLNLNYDGGETLQLSVSCGTPEAVGTVFMCFGTYNSAPDEQGARPALYDRFTNASTACEACDAVRLKGEAESPSFFARALGITSLEVAAVSTAVNDNPPRAQLTIRNDLLKLDGGLVNDILGLLGGNIGLTAIGSGGLADANVDLLNGSPIPLVDFLQQLILNEGLNIDLDAGGYEQVLDTDLGVGDILGAAVDVLGQDSTAGVLLDAIGAQLSAGVSSTTIRLADILGVQTGTGTSALDVGLSAFDLLTGTLMAANGENAVGGEINLSTAQLSNLLTDLGSETGLEALDGIGDLTDTVLGGGANITLRVAVIEKPRVSAVGDPERARAAGPKPLRANYGTSAGYAAAVDAWLEEAIYVRTAQVRLHISIDLPVLENVSGLLNAVTGLVNGLLGNQVAPAVNSLLSLNVVGTLQAVVNLVAGLLNGVVCLLACVETETVTADVIDTLILDRGPSQGPGVDVVLDVGGAEAYVSDYDCDDGEKTLTARAAITAAKANVGALQNPGSVFSSTEFPIVDPLSLIDIGTIPTTVTQRKVCGLLLLKLTCDITQPATISGADDPSLNGLPNPHQGPREPFSIAGVTLGLETPLLANDEVDLGDYTFEDPPNVGEPIPDPEGYHAYATQNVVDSLGDSLGSLDIEVYTGGSSGLLSDSPLAASLTAINPVAGGLLTSPIETLTETILGPLVDVLSNLLDPLVNSLLELLGLQLNAVEVGGNLTCTSGGRLVN